MVDRLVPAAEARKQMRNMSRSEFYRKLGRGELQAVKDGHRLGVFESEIRRYLKSRPKFQSRSAEARAHNEAKAG